jgi:hypothetical protein
MKKSKIDKQYGFLPVEIILLSVIIVIIGTAGWYVWNHKQQQLASNVETIAPIETVDNSTADTFKTAEEQQSAIADKIPVESKPKTTVQSPAPITTPTPPANTTNCLPPNPSPYSTYYIHMTNSAYLQSNSYGDTNDLYSGLQFAGLIDTVNKAQYVVLAPNDYWWDNLTQQQRDWMNASPENMRSVLGWQIITSCITWNGVNPVNNWPLGKSTVVNSVNGPVTFSIGSNGHGDFGECNVAIWDWFTSNGSVTFCGFVKPPVVP